jgi:hypothetical protein
MTDMANQQTIEQRTATETLRLLAGRRYRVALDIEGWPIIPAKYGQIEHHDGDTLAVYSTSMRLLAKLVGVGARRHQIGDDEYRLLFPAALLGAIAQVIKAQGGRRGSGAKGRSAEDMARVRAARRAA